MHSKIKEELDKVKCEYQTQDDRNKDIEKMIQIINKGYESSLIKPLMFWPQSFFGKIIAYDMYQRGIQNPTDKDVQEYANCFVCGSSNTEKNFLNIVFSEFDGVYNESEKRNENI